MARSYFKLEGKDEVVIFEKLLNYYTKEKSGLSISHISLSEAYEKLQRVSDGGRVFTALIDILINVTLLKCEMVPAEIARRKLCNTEQPETVLDSPNFFIDLMDLHRLNTAFIFRYRALWDKMMGFLILVLTPSDYDKFCEAKSKKRFFKNCMLKIKNFPRDLIHNIDRLLRDFDNKYRTPEAHLTGSMRKYSFSKVYFDENTQFLLLEFWTPMNEMLIEIGEVIKIMPQE